MSITKNYYKEIDPISLSRTAKKFRYLLNITLSNLISPIYIFVKTIKLNYRNFS